MHKTRNNAFCVLTGARRTRDGLRILHETKAWSVCYMEAQMMPVHPQRFEWIREDNLVPWWRACHDTA